jgi:hypothetical protein
VENGWKIATLNYTEDPEPAHQRLSVSADEVALVLEDFGVNPDRNNRPNMGNATRCSEDGNFHVERVRMGVLGRKGIIVIDTIPFFASKSLASPECEQTEGRDAVFGGHIGVSREDILSSDAELPSGESTEVHRGQIKKKQRYTGAFLLPVVIAIASSDPSHSVLFTCLYCHIKLLPTSFVSLLSTISK